MTKKKFFLYKPTLLSKIWRYFKNFLFYLFIAIILTSLFGYIGSTITLVGLIETASPLLAKGFQSQELLNLFGISIGGVGLTQVATFLLGAFGYNYIYLPIKEMIPYFRSLSLKEELQEIYINHIQKKLRSVNISVSLLKSLNNLINSPLYEDENNVEILMHPIHGEQDALRFTYYNFVELTKCKENYKPCDKNTFNDPILFEELTHERVKKFY